MKTFVIAEAGVNHNGSVSIAKQLIDVAVDAGADAVKFQTFKADKLVTSSASKIKYQIENSGAQESQYEMLKKLELSLEELKQISSYCREKSIIFMSTPFDEDSSDILEGLGMSIFKIPSGEITNKPLIQHIAKKKKDIILSTGMSYLDEVKKAVGWINEIWNKFSERPNLTLLHCVSNYPAASEDANLSAMETMRNEFGVSVGYSDHTMGIEVAIAAVALGAQVIEKHFTLDLLMEGPDHKASLEPEELKRLVRAIRSVEKALGNGIKEPAKSEEETRDLIRRSIVVTRDINKGGSISRCDIAFKRPGTGILPEFVEEIIGKTLKAEVKKDTVLTWDKI